MPCAVFSQRRKLRSAPMCSLKEMNIQGGLSEVRGLGIWWREWGFGGKAQWREELEARVSFLHLSLEALGRLIS